MDHKPTLTEHLPALRRTTPVFLAWMDAIDDQGWDGPAARDLLGFIRSDIIRPLVVHVGLRGFAASQAEASAWQEVWMALRQPALRTSPQPWGVVWSTARRAALGERVTARFGASTRASWRYEAEVREGQLDNPISLDELLDRGWQPTDAGPEPDVVAETRRALADAIGALRSAGWPAEQARCAVALTALDPSRPDPRCTVLGWRALAERVGIPPWQARRLTVLLRGTPTAPGLIRRLLDEGRGVLHEPELRATLHASRSRRLTPPHAALRAGELRDPQRRAS